MHSKYPSCRIAFLQDKPIENSYKYLDKAFEITALADDALVTETNINNSMHMLYSATESEDCVQMLDNYNFKQ